VSQHLDHKIRSLVRRGPDGIDSQFRVLRSFLRGSMPVKFGNNPARAF
jgi:hypothetical protein